MAGCIDHVIELGRDEFVGNEILDGDDELARLVIVGAPADGVIELDVVAHTALLDAALDVVVQHGARRERGNGPAEVLFEGVVCEFEALLGAVRPEIAIHAAVNGLAEFVETGAPCVVPHTAAVALLFIADHLRNFGALAAGAFEGAQCCKSARAAAQNGNSRHGSTPRVWKWFDASEVGNARQSGRPPGEVGAPSS